MLFFMGFRHLLGSIWQQNNLQSRQKKQFVEQVKRSGHRAYLTPTLKRRFKFYRTGDLCTTDRSIQSKFCFEKKSRHFASKVQLLRSALSALRPSSQS